MEYLFEVLIGVVLLLNIWLIVRTEKLSDTTISIQDRADYLSDTATNTSRVINDMQANIEKLGDTAVSTDSVVTDIRETNRVIGETNRVIGDMRAKTAKLIDTAVSTDRVISDIQLTHQRLTDGLEEFDKTINMMAVSNLPIDGFPVQVEACWEDVGARGRFLTDLGGMSVKMREQMCDEFYSALNKPMPTTPAAGSFFDVMVDHDEWLTKQIKQQDEEIVFVRRGREK